MSTAKSNSCKRTVFTAYFTYLSVAIIIASAIFVANNFFLPLFSIILTCISLTFTFTFIYRDHIAKAPWKYLSVFMLLFLLIMLGLLFLVCFAVL